MWIVPVYEISLAADSLISILDRVLGGEYPIAKPDDFALKDG